MSRHDALEVELGTFANGNARGKGQQRNDAPGKTGLAPTGRRSRAPGKATRTTRLPARAPGVAGKKNQSSAQSDEVATDSISAQVGDGGDVPSSLDRQEPGAEQGDWLFGPELARVIRQEDGAASETSGTELAPEVGATSDAGAAADQDSAESDAKANDQKDQESEQQAQADQRPAADAQGAASAERSEAQASSAPPRQGEDPAQATSSAGGAQSKGPTSSGGLAGAGGAADAAAGQAAQVSISTESPGAIIDSLAQVPASQAVTALAQAEAASPGALARQRDEAQKALPEIPTPTGLPAKQTTQASDKGPGPSASARTAKENAPTGQGGPSNDATSMDLVEEAPAAPEPSPTHLAGGEGGTDADGKPKNDPALARSAQSALATVAAPADQVPTQAADVPSTDMTGEADPGQVQASFNTSDQQTRQAASEAAREARQDFGENSIFPEPDEEVLRASQELSGPKPPKGSSAAPAALPAEAMAAIDAEASPVLQQRVGAEQQKYAQGKTQYNADSQAAHQKAQQDISNLEENSKATQQDAQQTAQADVSLARQDWQGEIEQVQTDFQTKATQARGEHEQQIQDKELEGNQRASEHIADAERQAEQEKSKAKSEAESKQREAKNESKGFWGWVKSKAKALVDGLEKAVNFIYDNLRKLVKGIFEAAKKLALAAIEVARMAIVGLITAYGAVLKGFVTIALAAFPTLRDKIKKRIDQAVKKATDVVNKAADALKKGVTAIIDFLASTIDKVLGLIQDLYNGLFTVIGMIISGELQELLARLGNLIDAAKTAPGQFETAAYEELLGGDLDQPLSPAELIAAGRTPPSAAASQVAEQSPDGQIDATAGAEDTELPGPPWTDNNVGVEQVATGDELSPEITEQLFQLTGGEEGEVTFGESQDSNRSLDAMLTEQGQSQGQATAQARTQTGQQAPAYDDGLAPRERAAIKWEAMKTGLANWWSENWPAVLAGGVLGVAGFIIANILTGGAILAALPAIMTAIGYIFSGVMVVQLASHFRDFLQKGWNGDIQGGGKSLAKGLAAGAIELIMLLTFKVGSAVLEGAKVAAKGVAKGARAVAKGAASVARRGVGYVIKGGKVLLGGVGRGIAKGAKRLRDLGARLLSRTRFKGFRIRIANRRFKLEGRINPWVLLADGDVKYLEADEVTRLGSRKGNFRLGEEITDIDGVKGVVVGTRKSAPTDLVNKLEHISDVTKADLESPASLAKKLGVSADDILPMYQHLTKDVGPAVITRLATRSDDEIIQALKAAALEIQDGGHSLRRHGPDVSMPALNKRLKQGIAPDGTVHAVKGAPGGSTRFKSYDEWLETREQALTQIASGQNDVGRAVDLSQPPDPTGTTNPAETFIKTKVQYSSQESMGKGYIGKTQTPKKTNYTHPSGPTYRVWRDSVKVEKGVTRVTTAVKWDPVAGEWKVIQHFPEATEMTFDAAAKSYKNADFNISM